MNIICSGLIISGGGSGSAEKSVEVFVPSTGQHCQLADLPAGRRLHTMEGVMLCGGGESDSGTRGSCLNLNANGAWEITSTLLEDR